MKTNAKKMVIILMPLVFIATTTYVVSILGAGVFWSTLASGVAGTVGGYMKNDV